MNILKLKLEGVEVLTKEQMKNVKGGDTFTCYLLNSDGSNGTKVLVGGDNCCQAQANADYASFSNQTSVLFPNGIDCPCSDIC